jgi:preprotein translocase subunit SecE
MRSELKKVQWPTWKQVLKNTGIVILCVLVVGVFIWIFDALAHAIIQALMHLFS